jgi:phosphoglycerate dehydrogenase-like enzyme
VIPVHQAAYTNGDYPPFKEDNYGMLLSGKTLGIIGLGRLWGDR